MDQATVENVQGAAVTRLLPREQLHPSPRTNPRLRFRDLETLAESLKEYGLIEPLVVRPSADHPGGYDIGAGDRRWRASELAGLDQLLCVVRDLSDRQMLEFALAENKDRDNLHPLEEAEGYRRLHAEHQVPVPEIAAKAVRSEAYVYARLRLCALCPPVREAFLADLMPLRAALALSRIASHEMQAKAWSELSATAGPGDPVRADAVDRYVRERYMLRLAEAPFSKKDATLVPEAGTCLACPKRTGNQPQLPLGGPDDDLAPSKDDLCTDEPCFARKREAHAERLIARAQAEKRPYLDRAAAARAVFKHGANIVSHDSAFIDPGAVCSEDPKGRTYKALLGKYAPPTTVAVDLLGSVREIYRKEDVGPALKAAGHDFAPKVERRVAAASRGKQPVSGGKDSAVEARKRAEAAAFAEAIDAALLQIAETAGKNVPSRKLLQLVARGIVEVSWQDTLARYARRHELDTAGAPGNKVERAKRVVLAHVNKLDVGELLGAIVELVVSRQAHEYDPKAKVGGGEFPAALALFKVDFERLHDSVRAPAKKAAPRAAKKSRAKPGAAADDDAGPGPVRGDVCRVCGTSDLDAEEARPIEWVSPDLCRGCEDLEAAILVELNVRPVSMPSLVSRLGRTEDVVSAAVADLVEAKKAALGQDGRARPAA